MAEYNAWPIGNVPKEFQRPELDQVKELGYDWKDPRDVVDMFEKKVAKFAGSRYAVAIDCCSHGLFLALQCLKRYRKNLADITIPNILANELSPHFLTLIAPNSFFANSLDLS